MLLHARCDDTDDVASLLFLRSSEGAMITPGTRRCRAHADVAGRRRHRTARPPLATPEHDIILPADGTPKAAAAKSFSPAFHLREMTRKQVDESRRA